MSPRPASPSSAPPEGTFYLPGGVAFGQIVTLVIGSLAPGQGQFDLGPPVFEVQLQRNDGEPPLSHLAGEPVDLLAVHQHLAGPPRLVVGPGALGVLRDVDTVQPDF